MTFENTTNPSTVEAPTKEKPVDVATKPKKPEEKEVLQQNNALFQAQKNEDKKRLEEVKKTRKELEDNAEVKEDKENIRKKNQEILLKVIERSANFLEAHGLSLEIDKVGPNGELSKLKFVGNKNKVFMTADCISNKQGNVEKIIFKKKEKNPFKALIKQEKFVPIPKEANLTYTEKGELSTIELSNITEEQKQVLERSKFEADGSETKEIMNEQGNVDQELRYYPDGLTEKDTKFSYKSDGTLRSNYSIEFEDEIHKSTKTQIMSNEPRYVYYDEKGNILADLSKRRLESIRAHVDDAIGYTYKRVGNPNKDMEEKAEEKIVEELKKDREEYNKRMERTKIPS